MTVAGVARLLRGMFTGEGTEEEVLVADQVVSRITMLELMNRALRESNRLGATADNPCSVVLGFAACLRRGSLP